MSASTPAAPSRPGAPVSSDELWKPSFSPWLIAASVMLATFMEILDTSVANVALPHIAGDMSATNEEATWVLTSYLVSNAIILPTTAWLTRRFGRKNFLVFCISMFTLCSFLSGAATSLGMLIVARILQGATGGALQPIAQSVLLESFPPEKRGQAMAAYGMGVVVAPILGPTLGGWITDNFSWRWIFYINLPIGILAILMAQWFVEDPPYIKNAPRTGIDYFGFSLMAIWLATLQIMFDKGQEADWFAAVWMRYFLVTSLVCMVGFILWELRARNPIVNLRIMGNRNFSVGTLLITVVGAVLYGTTALLPLFLQGLMGYPALDSGLAVSPRGLGSIVSMIVVGRLVGKVDTRLMIGFGFLGLGLSTYTLSHLSLDMGIMGIVLPNIINGFCIGFIFVPLTTVTTGTLPNEQIGNATGIFNLMRNIGGGIGISMQTFMLTRGMQINQNMMVAHMTPYDPMFHQQITGIQGFLSQQMGAAQAAIASDGMMYRLLLQQASLAAYVENFRFMGIACVVCVPLAFLFTAVKARGRPVAAH